MGVCMCVRVRACVCVRACVFACVSTHIKISSYRLPKHFHFSIAFIFSHNTSETLQKNPQSTEKRALLGQHKYVALFKLQRNPTEDLKNFSFQRDFYLIKLSLLDK